MCFTNMFYALEGNMAIYILNMVKTVLEKIKNIRELKNLTQEYVSEQLGISQAGYSKIENGTTVLAFKTLIEISKILTVNVTDILNFDRQKYFNYVSNIQGDNNGCITIATGDGNTSEIIKELYEDKIALLENLICKTDKLLSKTEAELEIYKKRYGEL